jgi:hypothetical protein
MDIKPIGPANVGYGNVDDASAGSPAKSRFPSRQDPTAAADGPQPADLAALAGLGTVADLNDPEKAHAMVRSALSILAGPELSQLKPQERDNMVDWMANDPAISGRMQKLLSKVLRGD